MCKAQVSAQHQLLGACQALQQDVGSPERHRQGLSGARPGDASCGAVQMADEFQLTLVQPRVPAQDDGRYARFVVHVDVLLGLIYRLVVLCNEDLGRPATSPKARAPVAIRATGALTLIVRGEITLTVGVHHSPFGTPQGR